VLAYEPDAGELDLLAYRRHDVRNAVEAVLRVY
jgi:hypothetical protein